MKFLTTTLILLSSLSAFALPEDYYFDAPLVKVVEIKVKVKEKVEATTENADEICKNLGHIRAASYAAAPQMHGKVSYLITVKCNK